MFYDIAWQRLHNISSASQVSTPPTLNKKEATQLLMAEGADAMSNSLAAGVFYSYSTIFTDDPVKQTAAARAGELFGNFIQAISPGIRPPSNTQSSTKSGSAATKDAGVRLMEDTDVPLEVLRQQGYVKPFSDYRVPQLPKDLRSPTFANRLAAIQKARDLSLGNETLLGTDLPSTVEFGVITNEAGELRLGAGGTHGIELTKPTQKWVGHTHPPGTGSMFPSTQDFLSIPSGGSEFFVDPLGRIHIIGRVGP
jgi:hypothetical protein